MFKPRLIEFLGCDSLGIKLYGIEAEGRELERTSFDKEHQRLLQLSKRDWNNTAAFCIFHAGASADYCVLVRWGNDNELFPLVSVRQANEDWLIAPDRYSFCLWDMEVFWHERNAYIRHVYQDSPNFEAYRKDGLSHP